jgi:hypothetical protein
MLTTNSIVVSTRRVRTASCGSTGSAGELVGVTECGRGINAEESFADIVRAVAGLLHHMGVPSFKNRTEFTKAYQKALKLYPSIRRSDTTGNSGEVCSSYGRNNSRTLTNCI